MDPMGMGLFRGFNGIYIYMEFRGIAMGVTVMELNGLS
jgi:hypothetical protein